MPGRMRREGGSDGSHDGTDAIAKLVVPKHRPTQPQCTSSLRDGRAYMCVYIAEFLVALPP